VLFELHAFRSEHKALAVRALPESSISVCSLAHYTSERGAGMDANERNIQISLVIPAYNEERVIVQAVWEAELAMAELFDSFEIVVVDDGSADQTALIVEGLLPSAPHTRVIRHGINKGYGAALRTGFEAARYEFVAFTDADCQFDLADLGTLASLATVYPIAAGFRVDRKDTWRRRFFSWAYNQLARAFLGTRVRDVDCALKVFRQDVLAQLLPESHGFFVNSEMMTRARQLGFRVAEHPVTHRPRAKGESKVSLSEIPRTAARLLRFWWTNVLFGGKTAAPPAVFQGRVTLSAEVAEQIPAPAADPLPARQVVPHVRRQGAA
jgi:cellulose synthase/poly-beta-1,6-N-acetylglucosamine synthase-like glycosyltransferase